MRRIDDVEVEKLRVTREITACLSRIRTCVAEIPEDLSAGLACLDELSRTVYEDLNQLQHEAAILKAIEALAPEVTSAYSWSWNPRQTGGALEPDLVLQCDGATVLSVEATASRSPNGIVGKRLRKTLRKLNGMAGRRYMAVTSAAVAQRARSIVANDQLEIGVIEV